MTANFGWKGKATAKDFASEYNSLLFVIKQVLGRANVAALCKVLAVSGGGVGTMGYVTLQPLLNQVDGNGDAIPSGTLNNVPYFRMQSGANAIIIDPQVGDVGVAIFSDKDLSAIKLSYNNGSIAQVLEYGANPNSNRRFDAADGLFFGGFFNEAPTDYIQFLNGIINLVATNQMNVTVPTLNITASTQVNVTSPLINLSSWAGLIASFGMATPPQGWLVCPTAQTLVSLTTYPRLSVLGTTWGGDGVTTVGLPFFPADYVMSQASGNVGTQTHGVVKDHTHNVSGALQTSSGGSAGAGTAANASTQTTTTPNAPEGGHDNLAAGSRVLICVKY